MNVGNCCSKQVVKVSAATSLREASLLMRNHHVGTLVVVATERGIERPVGIITDRDIVVAVLAPGARPEAIRAGDAMPTELFTVREDAGVFEAFRQMAEHGVRRLPVVRADGGLAGIVTGDDLLRVVAAELASFATALRRGGERETATRPPLR
jgi:CBS domain-containing protein